jgi:hypothetical protein
MLGASILTFWGFEAPCQRHAWYSHDNALNGDLTDILSVRLEQRWDFGHFHSGYTCRTRLQFLWAVINTFQISFSLYTPILIFKFPSLSPFFLHPSHIHLKWTLSENLEPLLKTVPPFPTSKRLLRLLSWRARLAETQS